MASRLFPVYPAVPVPAMVYTYPVEALSHMRTVWEPFSVQYTVPSICAQAMVKGP